VGALAFVLPHQAELKLEDAWVDFHVCGVDTVGPNIRDMRHSNVEHRMICMYNTI
jgi:hypothetical protein